MYFWSVAKFFFYLSLPWIVKKIFSLITKRSATTSNNEIPSTSKSSKFLFLFSVLYAAHQLFQVLYVEPQKNAFVNLSIPRVDIPGYVIKQHFSKYTDQLKKKSNGNDFEKMLQCRQREECSLNQLSSCSSLHSIEIPYLRLLKLSEELRNIPARKLYLKNGDDAYLKCTFCKDDSDYFLYNLPFISFAYVGFLVLIKIITIILPQKQGWFKFGCIYVVCFVIHEIYYYKSSLGNTPLYDYLFVGNSLVATRMQKLNVIRRLAFTFGLLIICLFDKEEKSPLSAMKAVNEKLQKTLNRAQLMKIQKKAIESDAELRRFVIDQTNIQEKAQQLIYQDEEFSGYQKEVFPKATEQYKEFTNIVSENISDLLRELSNRKQ